MERSIITASLGRLPVRLAVRLTPALLLLIPFAAPACGAGSDDSGPTADAGTGSFGPTADADDPSCVNLCKQQVFCTDSSTTLSGYVKDPAGKLPVYNAIVYVPNAPVSALAAGPSCDRCGTASGSPLVATVTDAHGRFVLKDVPAGKDIPLVVQIGKWRRQLLVPDVVGCAETPLGDIRLPRNHCEGDIPQIALTTGGDDAMECWLRKVGLDDTEFTAESGPGRIHLYAGSGAERTTAFDESHGGQAFAAADTLWNDPAKLARYDLVLLSCEGETFPATKPASALASLKAFTDSGGRVLASHWQRYWWNTQGADASPFPPFAVWNDRADPPSSVRGTIDTTLAKGKAMRFWLEDPAVAAADAEGFLPMTGARHNVDAVDPAKAIQWVTFPNANAGGQTAVALLSSNTPSNVPEGQQCGRLAYAALHASSSDAGGPAWPSGCTTTEMTPQEKALEFLLFDVSSCVLSDLSTPTPPAASTPPQEEKRDDTGVVPAQTPITVGRCDQDGG